MHTYNTLRINYKGYTVSIHRVLFIFLRVKIYDEDIVSVTMGITKPSIKSIPQMFLDGAFDDLIEEEIKHLY